jgi:hypothetical protein
MKLRAGEQGGRHMMIECGQQHISENGACAFSFIYTAVVSTHNENMVHREKKAS